MRPLILAAYFGACAAIQPCEFPLMVRITPDADAECRALGVKRNDNGEWISDSARINGCAPAGKIISNGTETNMGHEMAHQRERYCK
jgi:hypothetical protein